MRPIKLPGMRSLLQPKNWDETKHGKCELLPFFRHEGVFMTYWQPTFKERFLILIGRPIRLNVVAEFHPPVSLDMP